MRVWLQSLLNALRSSFFPSTLATTTAHPFCLVSAGDATVTVSLGKPVSLSPRTLSMLWSSSSRAHFVLLSRLQVARANKRPSVTLALTLFKSFFLEIETAT